MVAKFRANPPLHIDFQGSNDVGAIASSVLVNHNPVGAGSPIIRDIDELIC
ncbi:MAG: hypothetical protein F6K14_18505 [Symploca sp. SIO2C1]|nr:hypothetical protein [Symploca sp. SIO2C1]